LKIKELLYEERFTIAGAKKLIRKGRGKKAKEAKESQLDFTQQLKNAPVAITAPPTNVLKEIKKELQALRAAVK